MRTLRLTWPVMLAVVASVAMAGRLPKATSLEITSPRDGSTVNARNVLFSGTSDNDTVKVSGYLGTRIAFQQQVPVKNGRWSMSRPMVAGNYQIKAEDKNGSKVIDIRVVGRGSEIPSDNRLSLASPRNGSTLSNPNVTFTGSAESGSVTLTVYEGSRRVYSGTLKVRNGFWSQSVKLSDGSHSAKVEQNRKSVSVNFKVDSRSNDKETVSVVSPRNGQSVRGPRVTISGDANTPSVGVYIYNGRKRVFDSSTKVNRGKWMFAVTLEDGSYRVEIVAGSKKASAAFTVKK